MRTIALMSTSLMPVIITTQQGIYVETTRFPGRKLSVARLKSLNIMGSKTFSYIIGRMSLK